MEFKVRPVIGFLPKPTGKKSIGLNSARRIDEKSRRKTVFLIGDDFNATVEIAIHETIRCCGKPCSQVGG